MSFPAGIATPSGDPTNPIHLLYYALTTDPRSVAALPIYHPAIPDRSPILKTGYKDRVIPPEMRDQFATQADDNGGPGSGPPTHITTARALIVMPTDVVRNHRGPIDDRDVLLLFVVRRRVYEQMGSRIVVPQIVVPGSGI